MAGMVGRSLEPGVEGNGAFREAAGHAVAAARHLADRACLRAWVCRFALPPFGLAQGLSEAGCLPSENAGAAVGEGLGPARGVTRIRDGHGAMTTSDTR